jgi:tetratricopeptide (TPR) repeat protein
MASGADEREMISLLERGRRLAREQKLDEALSIAEQLINATQQDNASEQLQSEAWGLKGAVLHRQVRMEESLEAANRAVEIDSHSALALVQRASTLCELARYEEALRDADQAIALLPDVAVNWIERGKALRGLKRSRDALASFERALASNPQSVDAWVGVVQALIDLHRYQDALRACAEGEQVFATQPQQRNKLLRVKADTFGAMGHWEEALSVADQVITQEPAELWALQERGIALMELKRFDEALEMHRQILTTHSGNRETLIHVGQTYYLQDRQEQALAAFDIALRYYPNDTRIRELRASVLARLLARGQLPDGYSLADTPELDHPAYWLTEAQALDRLGEYEHAIAACDEGFRRYPAAVTLLNFKALILAWHFRHFREALQVYGQAIRVARKYRREALL